MKKKVAKSQKEKRFKNVCDLVDRIYIKVIHNEVHVYYRVTHSLVAVSSGEDGMVEKILDMSSKEFVNLLCRKGVKVRNKYDKNSILANSDEEKWYEGAWKNQTERYLESIGREMTRDSLSDLVETYRHLLSTRSKKKVHKKLEKLEKKGVRKELSLSDRIKRNRRKRLKRVKTI